MDLILGEDETLPRNRLALICHQCRLVNGQAPPGVQTLEAVGTWRCSGCNAVNGVENEGAELLKEIKKQAMTAEKRSSSKPEKAVTTESRVAEEDAAETLDNAHSDGPSQNTPSSGSGKEGSPGSGEATGSQRKTHTARRRSSRVKKKTKG